MSVFEIIGIACVAFVSYFLFFLVFNFIRLIWKLKDLTPSDIEKFFKTYRGVK